MVMAWYRVERGGSGDEFNEEPTVLRGRDNRWLKSESEKVVELYFESNHARVDQRTRAK
jgi:hypothetical protein